MKKSDKYGLTKLVSSWSPRPSGQTGESTGGGPSQKPPKALNLVDIFLSYLPLFWVVLFISFCVYAAFLLGRWPVAYIDDPQWIGKGSAFYDWFDIITGTIGFLLPIAIIACAIIKARHKQVLLAEKQKVRMAFFVLGVLLCVIIMFVDPFHRFKWFWD